MSYTSIKAKETVTHVESNTWTCGSRSIRIHEYSCKACHKPFVWTYKPYDKCPWCGFPVLLYRRSDAR